MGRFSVSFFVTIGAGLLPSCTSGSGSEEMNSNGSLAASSQIASTAVYHTSPGLADPSQVPYREVFEFTLAKPVDFNTQSNFRDVALQVDFFAPSGGPAITTSGFYFETMNNGTSLWKCRFSPHETGIWTYQFLWTHLPSGTTESGAGQFSCIASNNRGFLRINPQNQGRWMTEDGTPFFPIGTYREFAIDGGETKGAFGQSAVVAEPIDESLRAYADGGFNVFRFGQLGKPSFICAGDSTIPGDGICETYFKETAVRIDQQIQACRQQGLHVFFDLFGNRYMDGEFPNSLSDDNRRMIQYIVSRYAPYVSLWSICNEREPSTSWLAQAAAEIKKNDPYQHPVTNTYYPQPANAWQFAGCDFPAPHWFEDEDEHASDSRVVQLAQGWKNYAGPTLLGCQGNMGGFAWRPDSTVRMGIRTWTALFKEVGVVFNGWDITDDWTGPPSNIYLGRRERQYVQTLQRFASIALRPDSVMTNVTVSSPSIARAYGLSSSQNVAAYVHRYQSHSGTKSGLTIALSSPNDATGYWINPTTGQLAGNPVSVHAGSNTISVPAISIHLAFVTSTTPLDLPPVAACTITNSQWNTTGGDLDATGQADYCPAHSPFGKAPLTLQLDAGESHDWDGGSLSYAWDFGDGTQGSGVSVNHTYSNRGTYIARLTVTDNEGDQASQSFAVRVSADPNPGSNNAPVFHRMSPTLTVREGEAVYFTPRAWDRELQGNSYANDDLNASYFSVLGLPADAQFAQLPYNGPIDPNSPFPPRELYWIPDFGQAGSYSLTFQVHDSAGVNATTPLSLHVQVLESVANPNGGGASVSAYGTGKTTSQGGTPALSWTGSPSVAGGSFHIQIVNAIPNQNGYLFSGVNQNNKPFLGGTLYTSGSIRRLSLHLLDGTGSTDYAIPLDSNLIGLTQYFQFYFDDPAQADGTGAGLSNALAVSFGP